MGLKPVGTDVRPASKTNKYSNCKAKVVPKALAREGITELPFFSGQSFKLNGDGSDPHREQLWVYFGFYGCFSIKVNPLFPPLASSKV